MIQFKIFDSFLELRKDFSLSFSFVNSIFSPDKIELKRTQEFTIPATPKNNQILKLANRIDYFSAIARKYIQAEMWYSGGKIDGKMYISDSSEKEYKCVFVFGELLGLKKIQEAGKINKYINPVDFVTWDDNAPQANDYRDFGIYRYKIESFPPIFIYYKWNYMPSVRFKYLMDICAMALHVNIDYTNVLDKVSNLYIKLNGLNLAGAPLAPNSTINLNTLYGVSYIGYPPNLFEQQFTNQYTKEALVAKENVKLTFTPNFPENYDYNKYYILVLNSVNTVIAEFTKENTNNSEVFIDLQKGERFSMLLSDVSANQWINFPIPMSCKYTAFDKEVEYGDKYYLQPNLPDLTFIDLLKIVANVTNTSFLFNEATKTIYFFNFNSWENPENVEESIIDVSSVQRVVSDFAQKNKIVCKDSNFVKKETSVSSLFSVPNDTLEAEKEHYIIPLSGGNHAGFSTASDGLHKYLKINDIVKIFDDNGDFTYQFGKDADTICEFVPGSNLLQQLTFLQSASFLSMLQKSTQVKLSCHMLLFEFLNLKHNSTFIYRGFVYAIIEAKWSNNKCSLILQLI